MPKQCVENPRQISHPPPWPLLLHDEGSFFPRELLSRRGTRDQNGDPYESRRRRIGLPLHESQRFHSTRDRRDGAGRVVFGTSTGVAHAPGDAVHRDDEGVLQLLLLYLAAELSVAEAVQDVRLDEHTHVHHRKVSEAAL